MKPINTFLLLIVFSCLLLPFSSCRKAVKCTNNDVHCTSCQKPEGYDDYCYCIDDTSFHCPMGMVNGTYNYLGTCSCPCYTGWIGDNCDQRDTAFFISFRHGSDTAALSS